MATAPTTSSSTRSPSTARTRTARGPTTGRKFIDKIIANDQGYGTRKLHANRTSEPPTRNLHHAYAFLR